MIIFFSSLFRQMSQEVYELKTRLDEVECTKLKVMDEKAKVKGKDIQNKLQDHL